MAHRLLDRARRRAAADDGFTAVYVALMLVVMLIFAALVIDGGQAYQSHRQSQNAADAGAFAGVRMLDKIKFGAACYPTATAFCPFRSSVGTQVNAAARNNGADSAATAVQCYLIDQNKNRVTGDLCTTGSTGQSFTDAQRDSAYGVEVSAKITKNTNFARAVNYNSTTATTKARAMVQAYAGKNASPFLMCGSTADDSDSYDILNKVNATTYTIKDTAVNKFYALQASNVPECGGSASNWDGLAGQSVDLFQWNNITSGNRFDADVADTVGGVTPCDNSGNYNGCGLVLPVVSKAQGNGSSFQVYPVMWSVWQVWGNGTGGYAFSGNKTDTVGTSCGNPYGSSSGPLTSGGMKYCGKLLGSSAGVVSGGAGGGVPTAYGARVVHLVS